MKAYSVMNAKVCTFLSCHCKICEEYFSAICTFSCSMNESFQNESTCWAESRKPDCGVANSMEEQQCQSCDWILFHFGSASPEFQGYTLQKHRESHGNRDCPRSHRIILSWRRQCGKMDWDCNAVQGNCELNLTNQRVCKTWELWQLCVRLQCKALS